jgi:NHL repeat
MAIPLGRPSRSASCDRPERRRGGPPGAPDRVAAPAAPTWSCSRWGFPCRRRCRRRGALLPHRFTLATRPANRRQAGGVLSVALSLGSPPPGVTRHRTSVEPGLSSLRCGERPSDRLARTNLGSRGPSVKAPSEAFIIDPSAPPIPEERGTAMPAILGTDSYRYQVSDNWAKLPPGMEFHADVAAVGVDARDNVYAFNRGKHPMCVFDRDGNFLRSWGEGVFLRPHGVFMAPDGTIWLTDDGDHTIRQCTLDGKVLLTIGVPGKPAPYMSGEPFHRCTHTALSPQADYLYISDGYGNSRVHKYTPDGKRVMSWGEPGTDPGQFNIAHNICCDPDGWVYVADRENHRVQVFDGNGKYEAQWNNMHRPSGLYMESGTKTPRFFVGEIGPDMAVNIELPNCGPRVSIYTSKGELLARLGHPHAGLNPGQFISPHGLAVDSRGDIYVGEVSFTNWGRRVRAKGEPLPPGLRSLQKLVKLG